MIKTKAQKLAQLDIFNTPLRGYSKPSVLMVQSKHWNRHRLPGTKGATQRCQPNTSNASEAPVPFLPPKQSALGSPAWVSKYRVEKGWQQLRDIHFHPRKADPADTQEFLRAARSFDASNLQAAIGTMACRNSSRNSAKDLGSPKLSTVGPATLRHLALRPLQLHANDGWKQTEACFEPAQPSHQVTG